MFFKKLFKKSDVEENKEISGNFWYKGHEELRIKNYKDALNYFSKAIELDDKNKEAYLERGKVRKYLKDYENAIKDFSIAIELFTKIFEKTLFKQLIKGRLLSPYFNKSIDQSKPYNPDVFYLNEARKIANEISKIYLERSYSKKSLGDLEGAYEDQMQSNEDYVSNWIEDNCYSDLEDRDNFEQFCLLEKKFEKFKEIFFKLGEDLGENLRNIYKDQLPKEIKNQLIKELSKMIEINPNSAIFLFERGQKNYYFGYENAALKDYSKAIEIDPEYEEAYFARGLLMMFKGDYFYAIEDFTEVIKLNPNNEFANLYIDNCKFRSKDYEFSEEDLRKSVRRRRFGSRPKKSIKEIEEEQLNEYQKYYEEYLKLKNLIKDSDFLEKKDFENNFITKKYSLRKFSDTIFKIIKEIDNTIDLLDKNPSFFDVLD